MESVALTPVDASVFGHAPFLYALLKEREPYSWISTKEVPTYISHLNFIKKHPYRYWYVIEADGMMVGSIYLGNDNSIGVVIAKRFRRRGYARMAIVAVMDQHPPLPAIPSVRPGGYVANISPNNQASAELFTRLGFELKQLTYVRET